ncbi:MAG: hypothetical protein H7645_10215, partial [Candidatus Heimdallarchaeota archaeon]|nr:hypothetical protein [Candidatus Heimdallarchaeota archaeon]MCK4770702.1 hypothetical protein [Candidatus Heimdallarchaeota archaeon]
MARNGKSLLVIVLILQVILPSIILDDFAYNDTAILNKMSSSLNQEIQYDFNYTSVKEEFIISWPNLELDLFNSITLFFIVTGDKTGSSGLKVTFIINETTTEFLITGTHQDQSEHDITRAFAYHSSFLGTADVIITCEGKTASSIWSGTLKILSETSIESVQIPQISEIVSPLPMIPETIILRGSISKTRYVKAITAFLNSEGLDRCNLTLSFSCNDFDALSEDIEVEINGSIIDSRDIDEDTLNSLTFLLPLSLGINVITFHFIIGQCPNTVEINNIQLTGFTYSLESAVPTNVIDYVHWVGNGLDHTFDLSTLKPATSNPNQILLINIDYGYIGTVVSPAIEYSLTMNSEELADGSISFTKQTNSLHTLEIQTYSDSYQSPLTFNLYGEAEGEGIFYILNTSKIEIKPISDFSEGNFERTLITEDIISTSTTEPYSLTPYDVFYSDSFISGYNITISCELFNDFSTPITSEITLKIDNTVVFDSVGSDDNFVNITNKLPLLFSGYHEVNLTMVVYGNGDTITIRNLKYQIASISSSSSTPPDFPTDPIEGINNDPNTKEPTSPSRAFSLGFVGFFDFIVLAGLILRRNKKRKEKPEHISGVIDSFDVTIDGINTQQGWISSLISGTKNIWSKLTESAIKMLLFLLSFSFLAGKYIVHNNLLNRINSIAEKDLSSISFVSGGNAGYIIFLLFLCISSAPWYSIIVLSSSATYYEDHFFLATIVGLPVVIALPVSWIIIILYLFRNTHSFDSWGTALLPLCFIALYFLTFRLGKVKDKQRLSIILDFIKKGKVPVTMSKEKEKVAESEPLPEVYAAKQLEEQKRRIRNLIITEIDHAHPVPLERFAELENLPLEITAKHLTEISNETPSLGKYYRLEKYYVKNMKTVEIGNQTITSEENITYSNSLKDSKELDRVAIERDSEVNWVGIVGNRTKPSEGWIVLPAEMKNKAELGLEYDVFLFTEEGDEVAFTTHLRKSSANSWFFYISAVICSKSNLYGKKVSAFIKKHKEGEEFPWKKEEDLEEMDLLEWKKTKKVIEWEGTIRKGGGGGTGWLTLPMELRESAEPGQIYDLSLMDSKLRTHVLTAKLSTTAKGWGFYIPKALCLEYSLIGETVNCYIYQMEHFPVKISSDKIVRLPNSVVEEYGIKENDLFEVETIVERAIFREVVLITKIDRSNKSRKDEFLFTHRLSGVPTSTEARIRILNCIEKLPSELDEKNNYEKFYLPSIFPDAILGKVDENEMIIFLGNHVPILTPIEINLYEFVHYFGCFYADGTKVGPGWRNSASTPEQA